MPESPRYEAYDQRGRDGMGARERQAAREQGERDRTPEGQRLAKIEARLIRVEKGDNLSAGEGISINGNLIALASPAGSSSRATTDTIQNVIIAINGTAYYANLNGEITGAVT